MKTVGLGNIILNLTHYTKEPSTILQIIKNGFAYFPCERKVIFDLLPELKEKGIEPQQFGAISFTDINHIAAIRFRNEIGSYGIGVSPKWAFEHDITKVIYLGKGGALFESCKYLFKNGFDEFVTNIRYPDDGFTKMAFGNKWLAGCQNGLTYGHLLTLFEFMEPEENSWQSEWRIVNDKPDYGFCSSNNIDDNRKEVLKKIIDPQGWCNILNFVKIPIEAITSFYCPIWKYYTFRQMLPKDYRKIPIKVFLV